MKLFPSDEQLAKALPEGVAMPTPNYRDEGLRDDREMVSSVRNTYEYASQAMDPEFKEMRRLGDMFMGRQWTGTEASYLKGLGRVARTYNFALSNIIAVEGVGINNQYTLRAYPRNDAVVEQAETHTKILSHQLAEARYPYHQRRVFSDTLIFRRGWKSFSWENTGRYPDGQLVIRRVNPFDILFDADNGEVDINRGRFLVFTRFFTADRIRQLYASNNREFAEYLDRRAQTLEGPMYKKRRLRSRAFMYRERSGDSWTKDKKTGMGEATESTFDGTHPTTDYFDSDRGLYRLIEFHERRSADNLFIVVNPQSGKELRVPHEYEDDNGWIAAQLSKFGADQSALKWRELPEYWVVAVAPGLTGDTVLMERPYTVQDPQDDLGFSIKATVCYDQHPDKGKHLGLMDLIDDPQRALNRNLSTREDLVTRMLNPVIVGPNESFGRYWEDWTGPKSNEIGAVKRVEKVPQGEWPKEQYPPAQIAQLLDVNTDFLMGFAEKATGINANLQGASRDRGESGVLDAQRTEKSETMLQPIYENMRLGQEADGRFAHAMVCKHLRKERWIRIDGDNGESENIVVNRWDYQQGKWDLKLSEDFAHYDIKIDVTAYTKTRREALLKEGLAYIGLIGDPILRKQLMAIALEEWDYAKKEDFIEEINKSLLLSVGPQLFLPFEQLLQMQLAQMGITNMYPSLLPGAAGGQDGAPGLSGGALGTERGELSGPMSALGAPPMPSGPGGSNGNAGQPAMTSQVM